MRAHQGWLLIARIYRRPDPHCVIHADYHARFLYCDIDHIKFIV